MTALPKATRFHQARRPTHAMLPLTLVVSLALAACGPDVGSPGTGKADTGSSAEAASEAIASPASLEVYTEVILQAKLDHLSANQREMVALLIDAADIMNGLFWRQAYGDPEPLLEAIGDPALRRFAEINYGPWDRLDANRPFLPGVEEKPAGARFYPPDMTRAEFEDWDQDGKDGLYSIVERNRAGELHLHPYSEIFADELSQAAELLREAAELADDEGFANYLRLRADAFLTDDYFASDMAWMDNKTNPVELVIGPIETYEDQLYGYRAAFEGYVLIKDLAWSERLAHFAQFLPELQRDLPVDDRYKMENPGSDADLNAYDVVYYAGDSNAGSKTIAINLPNDERVQLAKGARRLQLKNAMRAKFDQILLPISEVLITPQQRKHLTFDAFFANTMFHEVAHGLGIKNTLDGSGTVRQALREHASALEEGKADILGLYMVTRLHERGELEGQLEDYYVTFLASIFRSVRFGASSAHGKANMVRFNYFADQGAFTYDPIERVYAVDFDAMAVAMSDLSSLILRLQGDGDYEGTRALLAEKGVVGEALRADLDRLAAAGIPVDIVFRQGKDVLGL
ncbi:MAG: Zn-dependent hydrolase [Pseudomonadota bacterium]